MNADIQKYQMLGEETRTQLKERIYKENKYDVSCELVAFSNSKGGDLVIGISDKTGNINPLSYVEVQETMNMLGNMASENVMPSILVDIENVEVDGGAVVIAHVKEGFNKPYKDNKGIVWVKNGGDKRKLFDNAELAEMMTECGNFAPDESAVADATIDDLDESTIIAFFSRNLRSVQAEDEFNSPGQLEIPYVSLVEFTVNALVHRSLNWTSPVRVFIFDNRVEIHSPGTLPNGLSVDDIVAGTSMPRNTFLFNNAIYLLPYTGAGSGIKRAMANGLDVQFENNESAREFVIVIYRKGKSQIDESAVQSNYHVERSNHESNRQNLTKKQEDICNFCSVLRTSQEIMDRLGISNQSKNRQKHIGELLKMGVLEMTIPNNPKDKNQKYRKVKH